MIVYSINNLFSYNETNDFLDTINDTCPANIIKVLVGNKSDLEDDRKVLFDTAYDESKEKDIKMFFETSAATKPQTIASMFAWLGEELAKHPDVGMTSNIKL